MSERGSPAVDTVTEIPKPTDDAPASAAPAATEHTDGTDAKSPADTSSPSDQPGATKQDEPKPTLLEVLKAAADAPVTDGKSPTPAKTEPQKLDPASDTSDTKSASDQDDSKLTFHNHPRWQEVVGQNKQFREQVAALEPDAVQYRKISSFMDEHHLTPDEVGELFIVGAMAKNGDPRCLQKIDEFRQKVALAMGETLPDDIQEKVETGELSDAAAKELAKARASTTILERRAAEREASDLNTRKAREQAAARDAQAQSVTAWEVDMRKRDPDFASKENAIAQYAKALIQDYGPPPTPKDAIALVEAAYKRVTEDFKAALPRRAPVQRGPVASSATGAKPQPRTLREAIEQAAAM